MPKNVFYAIIICCYLLMPSFTKALELCKGILSEEDKIKCYEKKALSGDIEVQSYLGSYYSSNWNGCEDPEKSVKYYSMAAENGNAIASRQLAFFYEQGKGVRQDYSKAFEYLFSAMINGDSQAEHYMCYLYRNALNNNYYCNEKQFTPQKELDEEIKFELKKHPPLCLATYTEDFVDLTTEQNSYFHGGIVQADTTNRKIKETHLKIKNCLKGKKNAIQQGDKDALTFVHTLKKVLEDISKNKDYE